MLRMVCLVLCLGMASSLLAQNQSNPFDLKYRPAQSKKAAPKAKPDSIKAPIQVPVIVAEPAINQSHQPALDSTSQNVSQDSGSVKSGSNPFELEKGSNKDSPVKPIEKPQEQVQKETVTPSVVTGTRHMSTGIQIFFILLSLLFLIFIVNVERNFIKDLWRVISNENYSSLHLRNQRNTMRQILLMMGYLIFFMQAGIFLCHLLALFGYSGDFLNSIWICIALVIVVYAVRHIVIRYLRWLFNNEKEMSLFGFDISTFNIMVGLVLLPINVMLNFGPDSMAKPLIIIGVIAIILAYLMRQLRWMLTARRLIANSLFLFFVYLCAVEILPLWAILTFFW
ncbi:MAG: DUF4271 domain-containing protein [Saprospiraceae bacterium]